MNTEPDQTDQPAATATEPVPRRMRRGWFNRAFCTVCTGGLNLALIAGLLVFLLMNQPLRLPDAVGDRVTARLADAIPGYHIAFGAIRFQLSDGWRPSLHLRDVDVMGADGQSLAYLSDLGAKLAMQPLLRGEVQPRQIWLSGAVGQVRRDADGSVEFSLGQTPAISRVTQGPGQLMSEWERVFQLPYLSALREIDLHGLTLQVSDPARNWAGTMDNGWMTVRRVADHISVSGGFDILSGADGVSTIEMQYSSPLASPEAELFIDIDHARARDVAAQSPGLEWLKVLDAPISGSLAGRVLPDGTLAPLRAELKIGKGVLQPTLAARPIPFDRVAITVDYDALSQIVMLDHLSVDSPILSASAGGVAEVALKHGAVSLDRLTGQFAVSEIRINEASLYDQPIYLQELSSDFQLTLDPFRLDLVGAQISDGQSTLRVAGEVSGDADGWGLALDAAIDEITPEQLVALWPMHILEKTRKWVDDNLSDGVMRDVDAAIRRIPGHPPEIAADFSFEHMTVRFLKAMPRATGVQGQASFEGKRFVAMVTQGIVPTGEHGDVDVSGTSFIIPDTGIGPLSPQITRLNATGSVAAAMALLDRPPLAVLRTSTLPVALAEGQVRATGTIASPMARKVPRDKIAFHFDGEISDVSSDVLVPGHDLTAKRLRLSGDQTGVGLTGDVRVSGVSASMQWRQPLGGDGSSKVTAKVAVTPDALEAFNIALPPGTLRGEGAAEVEVALGGGAPPRLSVISDLQGIAVQVPSLGWRKEADRPARLQVSARLGEVPVVERVELDGADLQAVAEVRLSAGGGLDAVDIQRLRIGDWLDVSGRLIGRGKGNAPDVEISGGRLDLRGYAPFRAPTSTSPGDLRLSLDQLQLTNAMSLSGMRGDFSLSRGLRGPFSGRLNGAVPLQGSIEPGADKGLSLRVTAADAGAAFRAMGILKRASGGKLDLALERSQTGQIEAQARVNGLLVNDAPALASLLNTISVVGLVGELLGPGLRFDMVDARFGIAPNGLVTLYQASAAGPAVGLSADGRIDTRAGRMDIEGVISPIYALNAIGAGLSRAGEGLFGFNYRLSGAVNSPSVSVNPLSLLTPGKLREIFRYNPTPQTPGGGSLLPEDTTRKKRDPFAPSGDPDR